MKRHLFFIMSLGLLLCFVGCPDGGGLPDGPILVSFSPSSGYQGTLVTIEGVGFSSNLKENHVVIGGVDAIVVSASPTSLEALVGFNATTGPIEVAVGSGPSTLTADDFELLEWPDADSGLDGPPIFYARNLSGAPKPMVFPGPLGRDLPSTGTINVLVVPCYPTDTVPPNLATERQSITDRWDDVHTFYEQASYGALDVRVDGTNWVQLCGAFSDYIDTARSNIYSSVLDRLTAECAQGAEDQGFDLDDYDAMACVIWVNGTFLRAWGGWSRDNFAFSGCSGINININVGHQVNLMALGETARWGRCAHELGHNIISSTLTGVLGEDVYGSDLVDTGSATASRFDIMGSCDDGALFSGNYMHQLGYYDNANIVNLQWDRNPFQQDYTLVAHGLSENTTSGRHHLLRIAVSGGLYYYVEVRQQPPAGSAQIFDGNIPSPGAVNNGGVIITKVITDEVNNNQQMRHITLLHEARVLTAGESAADPARALAISVVNETLAPDGRLVATVRVEWAVQMEPDPDADFNLWIQPWGPEVETVDIWIDREPWGVFDTTDASGNPTGNGDKPLPLAINHFWARAHGEGIDADNVLVHFYAITPPGVGDNGAWAPLPASPVNFGTITAGGVETGFVNWTPAVGAHTCLQAVIQEQLGENTYADNKAQENVFEFEAPAGSVPDPIKIPFAVRNPRDERALVFVGVSGVTEGYLIAVPHHWVYLDALGEREMEAVVVPLRDIAEAQRQVQPPDIVFSGWLPRSYVEKEDGVDPASWMMPLAGFTAQVRPKHRAEVEIAEDQERSTATTLAVRGVVAPALGGQPVLVRAVDPLGRSRAARAATNTSGVFYAAFDLTYAPTTDPIEGKPGPVETLVRGDYKVRAFIVRAPDLAQAESAEITIAK